MTENSREAQAPQYNAAETGAYNKGRSRSLFAIDIQAKLFLAIRNRYVPLGRGDDNGFTG